MAGLLLHHADSYYFGMEWKALLTQYDVDEYHSSDFYGRRMHYGDWTQNKRDSFQSAIVRLLLEWNIRHTGVVIVKDDYQRSFVETGFHRTLKPAVAKWKKPYLQAFQHTIADLRTYADHQRKGDYIIPVFDQCQEFMGQAQSNYAHRNRDGKLGRMWVSNARDSVQIQAADFLAWEYRTAMERSLKGEMTCNAIMHALLPKLLQARVWNYRFLDYLRRRVEACDAGEDPELVEL